MILGTTVVILLLKVSLLHQERLVVTMVSLAVVKKDMTENYMDYSNDRCLIMFTLCQRIRMRASMESSLVRKSVSSRCREKITDVEEREDDSWELYNLVIRAGMSADSNSKEVSLLGNYGINLISSLEIATLS